MATIQLIDTIKIKREIWNRKKDYKTFVKLLWPELFQTEYIHNWHIDLISEIFEDLKNHKLENLIFNIPPNHGKSVHFSILFNAYVWATGNNQSDFIYSSYDNSLLNRASEKLIKLMNSKTFFGLFPHCIVPNKSSALSEFTLANNSYRFNTTCPRGAMTGRHADFLIVDDPIKPYDLKNSGVENISALLYDLKKWWDQTVTTRLKPKKSHKIVVMQRLHKHDLCGHILDSNEKFEVIKIPLKAKTSIQVKYNNFMHTINENEILDPHRYDIDKVNNWYNRLSDVDSSSQLDQDPKLKDGSIFKENWFNFWVPINFKEVEPKKNIFKSDVFEMSKNWTLSLDATFKENSISKVAFSVGVNYQNNFYLIDYSNDKLSFEKTIEQLLEYKRKYPKICNYLIEDKANGSAIISVLKNRLTGIIPYEPKGSKISRGNQASVFFKGGSVFLPFLNKNTEMVKNQLIDFPFGQNDIPDTIFQLLDFLNGHQKNVSIFSNM